MLESAPAAAEIRPRSYQPARTNLELQGYVGKYPVRAVLPVAGGATFDGHVGDTWRGAYRYIGKGRDLQLEGGRAVTNEHGEPIEQEDSPTGAPREQFECQFEERFAGRVTGSFRGQCDTRDNELVVWGTWRDPSGVRELPFFLGPIGEWAEFDKHHRAILRTPGPAHECAAYVRVGASLALPDARQLVSYILRWPCEEQSTGKSSAQAFLGKLEPGAPHRFLVAPLPFGAVDSNAELSVTLLRGGASKTRIYLILRQEAERIQPTPQGPSAYACVPTPSKVTHRAFRFDERTPRLVPMTIDVNRLEKALPARRVLEGGG